MIETLLLPAKTAPSAAEQHVQSTVSVEGGKPGRVSAEFVKPSTGFAMGRFLLPARATPAVTQVDQQLLRLDAMRTTTGCLHAFFCLTPQQPQTLTRAPLHDVTVV